METIFANTRIFKNHSILLYLQAVAYEFNRKDCDIAFLRDMVTECKRISFENAESAKDLESRGTVKDQLARVKRCKRVSATIGDDQGQDCDSNDSKYLECISTADVVYAVVRLFGGSHFSKNSEGYCQKPFVRGCLPN